MGQAILRAISTALARVFGPKVAAWADQNGLPVFGILCLIVFVGYAWFARQAIREEVDGQTSDERRRNRWFGRWTPAALLLTGLTLFGRSFAFGSFESQKFQEVVWSLAAGTLGTTAWVLLMAWLWPTLTRSVRWKMRAGLSVPVGLGILFAVVGATRSPLPTAEEVAKAKGAVLAARGVVFVHGGQITWTEPKTDSPIGVTFHKRLGRVHDEFGGHVVKIGLRDDDLPPLLDALQKLTQLKVLDVSDTELTPAGVERVRAALPNVTVTGPAK